MKVAFMTLGCKVNQYETQIMLQSFLRAGFETAEFDGDADVYVVNTCSVTAEGDRKSRQQIRRAKRRNPGAVVIAAGCYPQTAPEELRAMPEADIVIGNTNKGDIARLALEAMQQHKKIVSVEDISHLKTFEPMEALGCEEHTRANIKIEDGCSNYCAYCIIPYARGPVRSKPAADVLREADELAAAGYPELVLTGIEISSYGRDTGESLIDLLEALSARHPSLRLRLGSLEPRMLTEEFLTRAAALSSLCPHFHVSLQSGSAGTLLRMRRKYTPDDYADALLRLHRHLPDAAVTTDVMVGFPGEDETEFEESIDFVLSQPFSKVHVFPFSPRRGTAAADMPGQVPELEKTRRAAVMLEKTAEQRAGYLLSQKGRTLSVLFETQTDPDEYEGFGENYIPVRVCSPADLRGRILPAVVTGADGDCCTARLT